MEIVLPSSADTIVALATPSGTAALAVVRISGPDTDRLVGDLLGRVPDARRATYSPYNDVGGDVVDDVVWVRWNGPKSYAGEDGLEITCHGNPLIAQKIVEDLVARGCRHAEPGEFSKRAFLNGRLDLSQAEAVMDVIHARSERALQVAQQQLKGALGRQMEKLIEDLLQATARIEAYIDFPEDDLPAGDQAWVDAALADVLRGTQRLLATNHYGNLLRDGICTVLLGEPNAGKSSLLNRLVGTERAIVSAEPGTTRDFIEEAVMVGPHCLRFIDTAGLNANPGVIEQEGMRRTLERADQADLFLVVIDQNAPSPTLPPSLMALLERSADRVVVVMNKSDLVTYPQATAYWSERFATLPVSASTGSGLARLESALIEFAEKARQNFGPDTVAINARHADSLQRAIQALVAAREKLAERAPVELLASDLREVLASFGEIAGRVDNERMLDALFATFCIGK